MLKISGKSWRVASRTVGIWLQAARRRHGRRQRRIRGIEGGACPTAVGLPYQFIGRPIMLVELERNDIGLAVPAHRGQAQRGTVGFAAYHLDERVQIAGGLSVHLRDAAPGIQSVVRRRRPVEEERDEYSVRRDAALNGHGAMRSLQR